MYLEFGTKIFPILLIAFFLNSAPEALNSPSIKLGTNNIEPMVLGNTLVKALTDLLDAIPQLMYYQNYIPGSPGDTKIKQIKSTINNILSKKNWTQ